MSDHLTEGGKIFEKFVRKEENILFGLNSHSQPET